MTSFPEQGGGRGRLQPQDRVHHHPEEAPNERGLYAIRGDKRDRHAHAGLLMGRKGPGFPNGFLQDFKTAQSDFTGYNFCYKLSIFRLPKMFGFDVRICLPNRMLSARNLCPQRHTSLEEVKSPTDDLAPSVRLSIV